MEIVKKNLLSIICGVVALLAVVSIFWPGGSKKADLQKELDARKAKYTQAQSLLTKTRHLPIIQPTAASDTPAPELKRFPNQPIIDVGQKAVDELKGQSVAIVDAAVKLNQHQPLIAGFFPGIGDRALFQRTYTDVFGPDGPIRGKQGLDSATPPDTNEVAARWQQRAAEIDKLIQYGPAPERKVLNGAEIEQMKNAEQATFEQKLRDEAAKNHKMYMDPAVMAQSAALDPKAGQSAKDDELWYAQVGLWVEQDVVATIHRLNAKARNVREATVKQLESLAIPFDATMYWPAPSAAPAGVPGAPDPNATPDAPVSTSDTDPLTKDFGNNNPTGRKSNALYDVIHFKLTLDVDAASVESVLKELEAGKLITVYQVDAEAVDSVAMAEQGFIFGQKPVVRLALQCEALFLRKWTKPLMPAVIKTLLKIPADETTPAAVQPQATAQ